MVNVYKLRVYPAGMSREVDRVLEICGRDTLDRLCEAILEALDFTHDHMYEFCMDNKMYSDYSYQYEPEYEDAPSTDIKIDKIGLKKGQNFSLHYDFGDDWMFTIHVQSITQVSDYFRPRLIKGKGSIEQYPSWDDYDEEDEWDDVDDWDEEDVDEDKDHIRFLRVRVRDGVLDIKPYKPSGEVFDYSGFTGFCLKSEYENARDEEDVVLVRFDKESLGRFPKEYIQYAEENDEDETGYYFSKNDMETIEWK